jgi:hypothetical protein
VRLLFDDRSTLDLAASGQQDFTGSFVLHRSGSYVVQAAESRSRYYAGSAEYEVEAIEDSAPKITITRPMRDVRATNVEEIFSELKAEDDIGVGRLELHYSVNGGQDKATNLYSGRPSGTSVTRPHTFFLEEFGLQPGDVVSYYGKVWDNNSATGPATSSSDIYFIEIRPFEQKYTQSQQQGGQGGNGEEAQEALSRQQKEIISATFKLIREKVRTDPKEYQDSLKSLALVQSRLQGQAQGLVDRLQRRGAVQIDENFEKLAEYLKNAINEMGKASIDLGAQKPDEALPPEQKSLQQLMRAESLFREIQVSFAQNSGASGQQANAQDLADLFELELNKLKNQYETVQRGEKQSGDQKVDEALQRLKELAQRQQQLNEANKLRAQQGSSSSQGGGGSQSQQQLMDEAGQLQRQLQRLSRERSSPQLGDASGQLQRAVDEMKRALNDSRKGNSAESRAQGMRALQQLEDARRKLQRGQESDLNQGLQEAFSESGKLVEEQRRIQEGLDRLTKEQAQASGSQEASKQRREDIVSRKEGLADRLKNLEDQVQNLSRQARRNQKETSGKLADAAEGIRDKRLPERILSGNSLIQNGFYEGQKQREDFIRNGLEDLRKQLELARDSLGQSKEGKMEDAANRARQLAEGLESMQQRLREGPNGQVRENSGSRQNQQGRQPQGQQSGQAQSAQGQEGRQASGAQGTLRNGPGQNPQNPESGNPTPEADLRNPSGNTSGAPVGLGQYGDEDIRQLQREFGQRLADAQELRRLLDRNSTQMENLDRAIESLRRAGDPRNYNDPEQIARLKAAIDFTRKIEVALSRDLENLNRDEKYFYAQDNEAPADYQKLVEEYFKSIAKSR